MRSLRFLYLLLPFAGALAVAPSCFKPDYASPGFYCHPGDDPACPEGQTCNPSTMRCEGGGDVDMAGGIVPKTASYSGQRIPDATLTNAATCPDAKIEPNDTINTAITGLNEQLPLVVDGQPGKLQNLAICPTGDNPGADGHDRDYFQITATDSVSAVVEIIYDIKYGDLDVGLFRDDGGFVAGDGSAVSNGCVAATLAPGTYYIGVGGANNVDVGRYEMRIHLYSTPHTCSTPDMGI